MATIVEKKTVKAAQIVPLIRRTQRSPIVLVNQSTESMMPLTSQTNPSRMVRKVLQLRNAAEVALLQHVVSRRTEMQPSTSPQGTAMRTGPVQEALAHLLQEETQASTRMMLKTVEEEEAVETAQ